MKARNPVLALLIWLVLAAAPWGARETEAENARRHDPHSFARPWEVTVTHLDLELKVDFASRRLTGEATLRLDRREAAGELVLDTDGLEVLEVERGREDRAEPAQYRLGTEVPHLGRPLIVQLAPETEWVRVRYRTSPAARALQWLEPRQPAGGSQPFLFTQSQAILARTWVPCQDSPGVRMTYNAVIEVPRGLLAVMSASNPTRVSPDGRYRFQMSQPIPSYLLALAVGGLEFRELSSRTGVYAEPPVIEAAAWEFADTERMMEVAEALYGPYRWERYDILVLPPSFPFGGMENPRLTFVTPTILAGDRSLVALIAHELAHSWSGNLATNASWNDFWLNEGFTKYIEHRIMESLYGAENAAMLARLALDRLRAFVDQLGVGHPDTRLRLSLEGRDPDEGMTPIAYEKGQFFLRAVESAVGRRRWDRFLAQYFDHFAFRSVSSEDFVDYLRRELLGSDDRLESRIGLEEWIFQPGLPANCPRIESPELERVAGEVGRFGAGSPAGELDVEGWTTHHWLYFLRALPDRVETPRLADLDETFGLTATRNSEVLNDWLLVAIRNGYRTAFPALEEFLKSQGRRKFVLPLYEALMRESMGELAHRIYREARPLYHPVSVTSIDPVVEWPDSKGDDPR